MSSPLSKGRVVVELHQNAVCRFGVELGQPHELIFELREPFFAGDVLWVHPQVLFPLGRPLREHGLEGRLAQRQRDRNRRRIGLK